MTRHTRSGDPLVVGLSGGMDSVVLLAVLRTLKVSALHIHHGLSPHADHWENFCRELCALWKIPLHVEQVEVERHSSDGLEAAARRARHAVFAQTKGWILLAHHRGDQAETLLFNLLRGTGLRGAAAMQERRGNLLRPLLTTPRDDMAAYTQSHNLSWIEDESNRDLRFSRNWLRHRVLPELTIRFPAAQANLAAATRRFAEAETLLNELAELDFGDAPHDFPIAMKTLTTLSFARAKNLLRYALARRHIGIPSENCLSEALRQCLEAAPDRHPAIALGHWYLVRQKGQVTLRENSMEPTTSHIPDIST